MQVTTGWVRPPSAIGGLDHLGTQAPCVLIYSQLLPGITNVTDRARYYSFYPWVVWSFDKRFPNASADTFREFYRRADCLFSLIAERHSRKTDHDHELHGVAMVGRVQLVPALDRLEQGQELRLSDYTGSAPGRRYFLNPFGGLGQYYAGALSQLELIDPSSKPWMKYTVERGQPLAEAIEAATPGSYFWDVLERDVVTLSDLDHLSGFCACSIRRNPTERQKLNDIFFDRHAEFAELGTQRRKTLALLLHLAKELHKTGGHDLTEARFRAAVYAGTLPGQHPYHVPPKLRSTQEAWALYERNDLLSITMQGVFAICLEQLLGSASRDDIDIGTVERFAATFARSRIVDDACSRIEHPSLASLVEALSQDGVLLSNWEHPDHEIPTAQRLTAGVEKKTPQGELLAEALRVFALLYARDDDTRRPYGNLPITDESLDDYPINLSSFRARYDRWKDCTIQELFADLFAWVMNTHLRVALRKLRQTTNATFRFRPTERGLRVVDHVPPPAPTTPRFRQAVQVLRDIGALDRDRGTPGNPTTPSPEGALLMEEVLG
jgi:hypothetical protein